MLLEKWNINKGVISELFIKGNNVIRPWGIETADSSAFFSLEDGIGYRYKVIKRESHKDEKRFKTEQTVKMQEGKWVLKTDDSLFMDKVIRISEVECLEDSIFMDFVMRFRFLKQYIKRVRISDRWLMHKNTNIYNIFPVDSVFLEGVDYDVAIKALDIVTSPKMKTFFYARDSGNEWVIHARMLPVEWDKAVIKLCNDWYKTRPLPMWLSSAILKIPGMKDLLWYRGEKKPYNNRIIKNIAPNAFPMVMLRQGDKLRWKVAAYFSEK